MKNKSLKIALVGNPNTGKTSLFNQLTGLQQQVGNYPGITVERKVGRCNLPNGQKATIIDLPGTYSLNTHSLDEKVVLDLLLHPNDPDFPDMIVVVSEVEHLKRNLLLFTQIKDLGLPTLLVINMADEMEKKGISIDIASLEEQLHTKVALISARKGEGIKELKSFLTQPESLSIEACLHASDIDSAYFAQLKSYFPDVELYKVWLAVSQNTSFEGVSREV
ncbi:MAG: FeoB small GTPase domain-containing protein, partial [Flavobacterium sp.]